MRKGKETLGYASRTEAVLALQADGLTNREIAARIGIPVSTVSALLSSAHRWRKPEGSPERRAERSFAALETAVMDLWEAGRNAEEIATATGIKLRTVQSVLGYMREGVAEERFGPLSVAAATAALSDAIDRVHPGIYAR